MPTGGEALDIPDRCASIAVLVSESHARDLTHPLATRSSDARERCELALDAVRIFSSSAVISSSI